MSELFSVRGKFCLEKNVNKNVYFSESLEYKIYGKETNSMLKEKKI